MIKLFYYSTNFGDELSRYIVEKLSGDKVKFTYPWSLRLFVRNVLAFLGHLHSSVDKET